MSTLRRYVKATHRRLHREPLRPNVHVMADSVRDHEVCQAEEVQVAVLEVDSCANISARRGGQHEKPVGQVRQREEHSGEQRNGVGMTGQKIGKPVYEIAVQNVLLKQSPEAVHQEAEKRTLKRYRADAVEAHPEPEERQGHQSQVRRKTSQAVRRMAPLESQPRRSFPA